MDPRSQDEAEGRAIGAGLLAFAVFSGIIIACLANYGVFGSWW